MSTDWPFLWSSVATAIRHMYCVPSSVPQHTNESHYIGISHTTLFKTTHFVFLKSIRSVLSSPSYYFILLTSFPVISIVETRVRAHTWSKTMVIVRDGEPCPPRLINKFTYMILWVSVCMFVCPCVYVCVCACVCVRVCVCIIAVKFVYGDNVKRLANTNMVTCPFETAARRRLFSNPHISTPGTSYVFSQMSMTSAPVASEYL